MINVVIGGATGKLGRMVCELIYKSSDMRLAGAVVSDTGGYIGKEIYPGVKASGSDDLEHVLKGADIYVDLTSPEAASKTVTRVPRTGVPMIIGTTAISEEILDKIAKEVAENNTSVLVSANFAIGANVFLKMCEIMADALRDYDIEIIETHHKKKKDAPSGTAMEALNRIKDITDIDDVIYGRQGITGPRKKEICVHSIRAGDVIGDHTVMFANNTEILELTHRAVSREAFAKGCIESIKWMHNKKDGKVHKMSEVLGI